MGRDFRELETYKGEEICGYGAETATEPSSISYLSSDLSVTVTARGYRTRRNTTHKDSFLNRGHICANR